MGGIGPTKAFNLDYHKLTHCHTVAQPCSLTLILCVFCVILVHAVLGTEQHKVFASHTRALNRLKEKGWSNRVSSNILMVCLIDKE